MANSFFQFKQFIVHQDKCAMKVCTDACLFGAWVANKISNEHFKIRKVLDIGTGTGLLSLMLAQKMGAASFDAVEINGDAAQQAQDNFQLSEWVQRLSVIEADVKTFQTTENYDLVISNPPFFNNDLKSPHVDRNLALHSSELSLDQLMMVTKNLVAENGKLALLLPFHRTEETENVSRGYGFFTEEKLLLKQTQKHLFFRTMFIFGKIDCQPKTSELTIRQNDTYSPEFVELLKDYYLFL